MSSSLFMCQRCNQPLKLSQKLLAMQKQPLEAQHHASSSTEKPVSGELQTRTSSSSLPDHCGTSQEKVSCPFILLGKNTSMRTLNTLQNTVLETSAILSDQKEVDQPLCDECLDYLLGQVDTQLTLVESDIEKYRKFLEGDSLSEEEREAVNMGLQAELQVLEQEEARLTKELADIDKDHAIIAAELRAAQAESKELRKQTERYWIDYSAWKMEQRDLVAHLSSMEIQLEYAERELRHLENTNIFNMTFTILDDGPVGIINNFFLGSLPRIRVGWSQINAAWGQTALLLFSLSKLVGLQFKRYQLVPQGSHSYLRSLTDDRVLLLFSDGSHSVFLDNKFDCGMKAFLDCLKQLVKEVKKEEEGFFLPYRINVKK
ncbi:beclin-2, partial [Sigmodon hispidus]